MKKRTDCSREAGLTISGLRCSILAVLESDRSHPGAEELYARLRAECPSLSLSTICKSLEAFLRAGLSRRVNADRSLRVDGTQRLHDHVVWRRCGRIADVDRRHAGPIESRTRSFAGWPSRGSALSTTSPAPGVARRGDRDRRPECFVRSLTDC